MVCLSQDTLLVSGLVGSTDYTEGLISEATEKLRKNLTPDNRAMLRNLGLNHVLKMVKNIVKS